MPKVKRFLILVPLLATLGGCGWLLPRAEPNDSGFLGNYPRLDPGKQLKKVYVAPNISLGGLDKVWVRPFDIAVPARAPWFDSDTHTPADLAAFLYNAREAFNTELASRFRVLPDRTFADESTIIVSAQITDVSVVPLPGKPRPWYDYLFPASVYAGIEIAVSRAGGRDPAIEIKDWRTGAQPLRRKMASGLGPYGDLLTIFYFWGGRLRQVLVEATSKPAAPTHEGPARLF